MVTISIVENQIIIRPSAVKLTRSSAEWQPSIRPSPCVTSVKDRNVIGLGVEPINNHAAFAHCVKPNHAAELRWENPIVTPVKPVVNTSAARISLSLRAAAQSASIPTFNRHV